MTSIKNLFRRENWTGFFDRSSFSTLQRSVALGLGLVIAFNTGLFSGVVHAQVFEVRLNDFQDESPEDLNEYGLVNVLVEDALLNSRTLNGHIRRYCERVQEFLGTVCVITPWEGETPSRIVEALQQLYFEGLEVDDGIGKLVGLVIVGDVPLPVVHASQDSFPSLFPYTDFVNPSYVFDPEQGRFVNSVSSTEQPQAEVWHGLIRPPGEEEERLELLEQYFVKNESFYSGNEIFSVFRDQIGFHDQYWENDAFDNETKKWYLKKMSLLDRIMNYRYSGEWLQELSGEAVNRMAMLTARTFDDASVEVERTESRDVDGDIGFDATGARDQANASVGRVNTANADVDEYGGGRLEETVPDSYSPGPIRNFLKDYVHVVNRYVSGTAELLDTAGRRQSYETLASLITKMDKFESSIVYLVTQEFEKYLLEQAKTLALDFELIREYERPNDYYTEEVTNAVNELKNEETVGPPPFEDKLKTNVFGYGSKIFNRYVNGVPVEAVDSVEACSLVRGSNFVTDSGELGRAVSLNRKDNPLTAQDISGASGREVEEEIKQIYRNNGYCSYMVKDQCMPGVSKVPLFDYAASEIFTGQNDYRRCFNNDGPNVPEAINESTFHLVPSLVNHDEPRGETVRAMLEKKLAHYFPLDVVRHASFFIGGAGQYADENVGRLSYPNFFELKASPRQVVAEKLEEYVEQKERELRKMRVEANWKRFEQYLSFSTPVSGRPDFWNYNEIPGFSGVFQQYKAAVIQLLRPELDPSGDLEDFEVVEQYLIGSSVSLETEQKIQDLLEEYFPTSLASQGLDLKCDYSYEVPPINIDVKIPEFGEEDIQALVNPLAQLQLLTRLEVPKFSPPSVSRTCENKIAKNTVDQVKTLRGFYISLGGVKVDVAILHNADNFVEILDPVAVLLYFTPPPPTLPPNTNMAAAVKMFDLQLEELEKGKQPVTQFSKIVKPVLLQGPGELQSIYSRHAEALQQAISWLNLSIEGKHKEGLSLLAKEKEMLYLVMNGDAQSLDFTLSQLSGSFEPDADEGIASSADILDRVREGEKALQEKLEEDRNKRELERRMNGDKPSKCGDSVPLLEWPEAVSCWLDEIISGPLIIPAGEEFSGESSENNASSVSANPGAIVLSQSVLTLRDRATARINVPADLKVEWSASGSVRVVPEQDGNVSVIPTESGVGSVTATFDDGSGARVVSTEVRVVSLQAVLRQKTTGDFEIGSDNEIEFIAEIRNPAGDLVYLNTSLQVFSDASGVEFPAQVVIQDGVGTFSVKPGESAKITSIAVGSQEVARSALLYLNPIAGSPDAVVWNFGDRVIGIDREIRGTLSLQDSFGNPYRSEGLQVELVWDPALIVNGKTGGRGKFFVIAGELPLKVQVSDDFYEEAQERSETRGYGYEADESLFEEMIFSRPKLRVEAVEAYPDLKLPMEVAFDADPSYRVQVLDFPSQVPVGDRIQLRLQVSGSEGILNLRQKQFLVQQEFAGEVQTYSLPMQSSTGELLIPSGASAGVMRLVIDDPDFGSVSRSIEIIGQQAARIQLESAEYTNGSVEFSIVGKDAFGNPAALSDELASLRIIGEGGVALHEKSILAENGVIDYEVLLPEQPDRVRLEIEVEGFEQTFTQVLSLKQVYSADDLRGVSFQTPYVMLGGGAFADYRVNGSVAQSLLFSDASRVQAITSELAPHYSPEKVAQIWPSGRTVVGPDMKVEIIWENLKPVLVYSDAEGEVGRLFLNPRSLLFEVPDASSVSYLWNRFDGAGKAVLVPENTSYTARTSTSGDLMSAEGEKLISFENNQVELHDPTIQTNVYDDSGDVLIVEFSRRQQALARWYLHFNSSEVQTDELGSLQWQFTGMAGKRYEAEYFYAGEGTLDERGLLLLKKGTEVRTSLGQGRSALDDVRENNGQGFFGQDKAALSFLAGNTVGESTLLQSEGIVNLGDPMISLRQVRQRSADGELVPLLAETPLAAESDFSIGQFVYAPEDGEIEQLLRVDVEADGDDDLAVVIRRGNQTIVRYLEGNGEGKRWGKVSDLLNLEKGVRDVQVLQGRSFVVLYESGQVLVQQNLQGRYVPSILSFSALEQGKVEVSDLQVQDFDKDGFDDLLFLTGDRELWLWYGSQTLEGIQFGVRDQDRQILRVVPVRLQAPEKLRTGAWMLTSSTPSLLGECAADRLACQSKYFRSYDGALPTPVGEEEDRLQTLIDQSQVSAVFEDPEEVAAAQPYMVRLDQLSNAQNMVNIELLNAEEGTGLRVGQQLDFEVTVNPVRTEEFFVLRYDLGTDFSLVGQAVCDGCGNSLRLMRTPDSLWSLEGTLPAGRVITITFTVEYQSLPDFSFQVMNTNADEFSDIGINVAANATSQITVFESRGPREYTEIVYGRSAPASSATASSADTLTDLMRGIGLEGKSTDDIKKLLLEQQQDIEASAGDLFDQVHEDNNADGFPDVYQENPSLLPEVPLNSSSVAGSIFDFFSSLIPGAKAQGNSSSGLGSFPQEYFSNLENAQQMVDNIAADVELLVKGLKCSRGCLPLPMNFAFLAPGPINIFGSPAGFDPGVPVFGVSPAPFFIWPPLVPYQATQFRFYISPTLTGGVGLAVCLGPYLLGQCMVFAIPLNQLGGEAICDAAKQGLEFLMQNVYAVVGQVNAAVDDVRNELNRTGVIKAKMSQNKTDEVEGIIGVSLGGGVHEQGINPLEPKIFLQPVPKIFVDWWDRQWEEVINSLSDLPDITVRLPDLTNAFGDREYFDKLSEKVSGETFLNLQQMYDLINSLPVIHLQPKVLKIQIPWIEPGMLRKIEQSLYEFLYNFLLEMIAFLRSFNLPCNITVVRADLFKEIRSRIKAGRSEDAELEIKRLKDQLEGREVDLVQAQKEFQQFSEREGFAQETVELRRAYFAELEQKKTEVNLLNSRYTDLEDQIQRLEQPEKISDILPVFVEVLQRTGEFWNTQVQSFSAASLKEGANRETAEALRACVALNLGVNLTTDVSAFVNGIQKNIDALETWKRFPRELAKYLNVLEFYTQEVIKVIDQLTSIVLKWWSEFERKLDLWIDVIFAYEEFIALVKLLLDILKGYNKKCGLCTSDRLTLKELILKLLFGIVPKFPIIDFPTWPDIRLDFSEVDLSMDVAVPVFDVRTVDLKWPKLPQIKFPRFEDIQLSAAGNLSVNVSVTLPEIPLVIPPPPVLPPLPTLPNIPKIQLPNLPPAPEVPQVLEGLLPLMKIIQTVLDIWCLINKSLLPIDEKLVKTQIENLTNRSLNLILPIDLLLEVDLLPGDLLTGLVPFDTIDVKSTFQAGVSVDPLPGLQETIDQQFHQPMNALLQQIDGWIDGLRRSSEQGLGSIQGELQNLVDQFSIEAGVELNQRIDIDLDLDRDFSELINFIPRPKIHTDLIGLRKQNALVYHDDLKQHFQTLESSLVALSKSSPEDAMNQLAQLQDGNVLVAADSAFLKQQIAEEKTDALYAPENMVEKRISLLQKPKILAQLDQAKSSFETLQDQMLGTETAGVEQWGTAIVRNGEVRRIQDYALNDPAVVVWDNDVFLGYEKSLYLKSVDGTARRPVPYEGRVQQLSLDTLQRSAVPHLQVRPVSSDENGMGSATVRWAWESPSEQLELTVWDTVGKAQRLDSRHLRFYLNRTPDQTLQTSEYFQVLNPGVTLQEGQEVLARQAVRLRFGEDLLTIPSGMSFTIPSFILRSVLVEGEGTVSLENFSGKPWNVSLAEESELLMGGVAEMGASGPQEVKIPALVRRPFVTRLSSDTEGALRSRVVVESGDLIPSGEFYVTRAGRLVRDGTDTELELTLGMVFTVASNDHWVLKSGRGEVVVSEDLEYTEGRLGMVLMDDELLTGSFTVNDDGAVVEVLPEQQVVWSEISNASFEVTVPLGNYYGRIREKDGKRGFSQIVHAAAQLRHAEVQVVSGLEQMAVPIYTPLEIDGRDYIIGDLSAESYHWRLEGEEAFVSGQVYQHPGFSSVGKRLVELYVRSGENEALAKRFEVSVFLPEVQIDEALFEETRVLRVSTQPPVANIPIGIVGERDGVQDWLIANPSDGTRLESRYYTDENGIVQLPPLDDLEGMNIIIEDGKKVARLYPNGRVVLNEEYKDSCQNDALLDIDGYLKFRISCVDNGRLETKFEVRMVPDLDTDVSIVEVFTSFDRGVTVRALQAAVELMSLPRGGSFAPGSAQARVQDGEVLLVLSPDGRVELVQEELSVVPMSFENPMDPLVWQVFQSGNVLLEFVIKGPDQVAVVDPVVRDVAVGDEDGDGMLDRWETTYGIDNPSEDPDLDGLTNLQEFQMGTNPLVADTDGDSLSDGDEVNPLSAESAQRKVIFSDVSESSPYYEAIRELSQFGFIQGYGDGTFRPEQAVTRAEALKIIMSAIRCENCELPSQATKDELNPLLKSVQEFLQFHNGLFSNDPVTPVEGNNTPPEKFFSFGRSELQSADPLIGTYFDVKVDDWYYYCIEIATKLGLVNGYRGFENGENALGKFLPNRGVNIAELLKIVVEAIGEDGKQSDRVYGPQDGWWNDPSNNYLAKAEEDLQLLLSSGDYSDPLRQATRAEVVYAAWRVLKENGTLDFDEDGVSNRTDQCPCQPANTTNNSSLPINGCPAVFGPVPGRTRQNLFSGIEITQLINCRCLVVIPADLFLGSSFFGVITGAGNNSDRVFVKSNVVQGKGTEGR